MARTRLDALTTRVTAHFQENASRYGLDSRHLDVRYILNWGGFVNASFVISDGRQAYHLKLADDPGCQEQLRRWQRFHVHLTEQYHAPRLLDWVKIARTRFTGLLFEYIPGDPVDFLAQPEIFTGVLGLLNRLHNDQDLRNGLIELDGPPSTCADNFLDVYIDRFDEDLLVIAGDLPPFVSLELLSWMMSETREMEGLVRDDSAFQVPAAAPTHGDLWPANILVTHDSRWFVIDWDDLSLGDPALEYSIVIGPSWRSGSLTAQQAAAWLPPEDALLRRRFEICLRGLLLDEVIDSLADWVESGFAPDHQKEVREVKEQIHRAALARYRELYPV